jgi:Domain of unknown function (DUF4397)
MTEHNPRPSCTHKAKASLAWVLAMAIIAPLFSACNGSDSSSSPAPLPPPPASATKLRAIHASSDAPSVDVIVNGAKALIDLRYKVASAFLTIPSGTTTIAVNPTATDTSVLNVSAPLSADRQYSAVVIGLVSDTSSDGKQLQAVLVDDPGNAPATGNVKVRVIHGAPEAPAVDVYVTAPGAALPATPTIPGLAYAAMAPASGSNALEVPGGSYQIRVTVTGDATKAIVFDSGAVTLPANADLLVTAIPALGIAPVSLLVAPSGGLAFEITDSRAAIRVGHLSPNIPAVNVALTQTGSSTSVLNLPGVTFPTVADYSLVPGGQYDASVALASAPDMPVLTLNGAKLAANTSTSVFAIGLLGGNGAQAPQLAAYLDDRTPVAGKAKIRVIHLSPDAPAVDVVALGSDGTIAARLITNLAYPNAAKDPLVLAPGSYMVAVVPTGASAPVLPSAFGVKIDATAGQVATVLAIGCLDATKAPCLGGSPFTFKVLSDN